MPDHLATRAQITRIVRRFFDSRDYLEVETPIRLPAPIPETHIDPQPSGQWVLQSSPEALMKRLLAAGYQRLYQICKCFRQAERGRRHLPEMTLLEWYTAHTDYHTGMRQCEGLIAAIADGLQRGNQLTYRNRQIDLRRPWERMTLAQAFDRYGSLSLSQALEHDCFEALMGDEIEPQLGRHHPVFIIDYPLSMAALARAKPDRPDVAERFELYIDGLELCNAFSELVDVAEQVRRFERDQRQRAGLGKPVYPMPQRFLEALAHMPPACGCALGMDRLAMLFCDAPRIDDVVAFTPEAL